MPVLSVQEITNNIIAQMRALDPAISAEIGTPERKIIEAVAEVISVNQSDLSVLNSQHDVDTMSGNRLDQFLANFGFGRQRPTSASGIVTFSRSTPATQDILVPQGVQVISRQTDAGFPSVLFVTTSTALLPVGATSVDVPVEATLPGSLSNIPANSIYQIVGSQSVPGVTDVTNNNVIQGGTDGETDDSFKIRFKNTIFRNMSGTTDQFLAFAVSLANVSKANVIGPMSRYQEYIQVPATDDTHQDRPYDPSGTLWAHKRTSAISTISYSKYIYDTNYFLTDGATDSGASFYRDGVDYVFNNPRVKEGGSSADTGGVVNFQPNVTFLNSDLFATDDIALLEHAYMSSESRNDPSNGIYNCVDLFIDGKNEVEVTSVESVPVQVFTNGDGTASTDLINYTRRVNGTHPTINNFFQPVFWQPMETLPDSIVVGDNTFYKANFINGGNPYNDAAFEVPAHYYEIIDQTEFYGSVRARNGIEWVVGVNGDPVGMATAKPINSIGVSDYDLGYTYDQNIADLQALLEKNKQITTDVLAHQSQPVYLKLYITVAYSPGANIAGTNFAITTALSNFYHTQYFGAAVQLSDLLQTIHNTPGVDNVKFTEAAAHPIVIVSKNGTPTGVTYDADFFLRDNQLLAAPDVNGTDVSTVVVIKKRASNTWNTP